MASWSEAKVVAMKEYCLVVDLVPSKVHSEAEELADCPAAESAPWRDYYLVVQTAQ